MQSSSQPMRLWPYRGGAVFDVRRPIVVIMVVYFYLEIGVSLPFLLPDRQTVDLHWKMYCERTPSQRRCRCVGIDTQEEVIVSNCIREMETNRCQGGNNSRMGKRSFLSFCPLRSEWHFSSLFPATSSSVDGGRFRLSWWG